MRRSASFSLEIDGQNNGRAFTLKNLHDKGKKGGLVFFAYSHYLL